MEPLPARWSSVVSFLRWAPFCETSQNGVSLGAQARWGVNTAGNIDENGRLIDFTRRSWWFHGIKHVDWIRLKHFFTIKQSMYKYVISIYRWSTPLLHNSLYVCVFLWYQKLVAIYMFAARTCAWLANMSEKRHPMRIIEVLSLKTIGLAADFTSLKG